MLSLQSIEYPEVYEPIWQKLKNAIDKKRIPNGYIFSGNNYVAMLNIAYRLIASLSCSALVKPCGECRSCHLIRNNSYENLQTIIPENSVIKVEQIRALQTFVFSSSLNENYRFILIEHAEKLNLASSNALLKILEEPPIKTSFILLAQNADTLPVTILSRCHQYYFDTLDFFDYEAKSLSIPVETMLDLILKILHGELSPCATDYDWKSYDFSQLLMLLYSITASAINCYLYKETTLSSEYSKKIVQMVQLANIFLLFDILDYINDLNKKIRKGINLNIVLSMESLLAKFVTK